MIRAMTETPGSRPWKIAIACQKGGVGKTTVALGLAAAITDSSGSVLLLDTDPQQTAYDISKDGTLPFEVRPALSPAAAGRHQRDPRLRHGAAGSARQSR